MPPLHRLQLVLGVGLLFAPSLSQAAENGAGLYLLGAKTSMAGYLPPPGVYVENDFYIYDGHIGGERPFPAGGRTVANVDGEIRAWFGAMSWVTPLKLLGGDVAIGGIVPVGYVNVKAGVDLDLPRLGRTVSRSLSDDATVIGDPIVNAMIGWHAGDLHANLATTLNIPVGDYRRDELANLAFHRWVGDVTGSITWFDPKAGYDLSLTTGLTFNGTNFATNYRTGTELHLEWAATKSVDKNWAIGLAGYHYEQLTGDGGEGARLGAYKGRVTGLGGLVRYQFQLAQRPVTATVKAFGELGVKNRMQGTAVLASIAFPLHATE